MALTAAAAEDGAGAGGAFVELEIRSSDDLARVLESQKELFHKQTNQLQDLVITQCRQTGINPLSQQMAVGALSLKIGKRPRDMLNPKAVKYMQSIFSIKDSLNKTETREISTLCRITASQVKDYFSSQRAKVRKLVSLSRKNTKKSDVSVGGSVGGSSSTDQVDPSVGRSVAGSLSTDQVDASVGHSVGGSTSTDESPSITEATPLNMIVPSISVDNYESNNNGNRALIAKDYANYGTVQVQQQAPGNSTVLMAIDEGPSCSIQESSLPEIDADDKKFLENIFSLMRKEEKFSGMTKLMEWVLQIHSTDVLHWFLTKGGLAILATWLSEAAAEEQTTLLLVVFKVLGHLPLHKALPIQMKAVLPTVNSLRFYRTSEISEKAKTLLSKLSKLLVRSQAQKKPSLMGSNNMQKEMLRIQSEILGDGSWQSDINISEEMLALEGVPDSTLEPKKRQKLLQNTCDESTRANVGNVSAPKSKVRRKVVLVEQRDCRSTGKSVPGGRAVPSSKHSRPMSADDIQKAKMHNIFMQNKYGKTNVSTRDNQPSKTGVIKSESAPQLKSRVLDRVQPLAQVLPQSISLPQPLREPKRDEHKISSEPTTKVSKSMETLKCQFKWHRPPAMPLDSAWKVVCGENSNEMAVQNQRNRREKETFYANLQDVPPNPKELWDIEMDFDDSLTPAVPIEPPHDADFTDSSTSSHHDSKDTAEATDNRSIPVPVLDPAPTLTPASTVNVAAAPDMELLAVLLKNPELVFALTSGQGSNLTNEQTVALLDTLKRTVPGAGLSGLLNGSSERPMTPVPTSLASPTPSTAPRTNLGSEFPNQSRTPVPQPHFPTQEAVRNQPPPPLSMGLPAQAAKAIYSTVTINSASQMSNGPLAPVEQYRNPQTISPHSVYHHAMNDAQVPQQHHLNHPSQNTLPSHPPRLHSPLPMEPPAYPSRSRTFMPGDASTFHSRTETFIHPEPPSFPSRPTLHPADPQRFESRAQTFYQAELSTSESRNDKFFSAHSPTPQSRSQPPFPAEPPFQSRTQAWPPVPPENRFVSRRGMLEPAAPDAHFGVNQDNYNSYSNGYVSNGGERYNMPGRPETWTAERNPVRSTDYVHGWNYTGQKTDPVHDNRPELSTQRGHGRRDQQRENGRGRQWNDGNRWHRNHGRS